MVMRFFLEKQQLLCHAWYKNLGSFAGQHFNDPTDVERSCDILSQYENVYEIKFLLIDLFLREPRWS